MIHIAPKIYFSLSLKWLEHHSNRVSKRQKRLNHVSKCQNGQCWTIAKQIGNTCPPHDTQNPTNWHLNVRVAEAEFQTHSLRAGFRKIVKSVSIWPMPTPIYWSSHVLATLAGHFPTWLVPRCSSCASRKVLSSLHMPLYLSSFQLEKYKRLLINVCVINSATLIKRKITPGQLNPRNPLFRRQS